jgi:hypothetical protein
MHILIGLAVKHAQIFVDFDLHLILDCQILMNDELFALGIRFQFFVQFLRILFVHIRLGLVVDISGSVLHRVHVVLRLDVVSFHFHIDAE